jgi:hypothetical protein
VRDRTRSCGCLRRPHGLWDTKTYAIFSDAKSRCRNPRHQAYRWYGGRGIEFRFNSITELVADIGLCPPGLTLDRIDKNGHYEKGNVRWATRKVQANNRRNNRLLTLGDLSLTPSQWASKTGIPGSLIYKRVHELGWPVQRALSMPAMTHAESIALMHRTPRQTKITAQQAIEIYDSKASNQKTAKVFGVSSSQVQRIKTGLRWQSATGHKKAA